MEKNGFGNRDESRLSDYKIFWRFQWRIRVDSVFTQYFSKSRDFSIATFGGLNQACRYGDTWVWMKKFFLLGSIFGILGLSGLRHKERIQERSNRLGYRKIKDWDLAARSQVSGYGGLVVGIDKKMSKLLAVVWHSWTYNIPIQRESLLLAAKLPVQLQICRFRLSWRKLDW